LDENLPPPTAPEHPQATEAGPAAPVPPACCPEPKAPGASAGPADYSRPFFWVLLLCLALGIAEFITPAPAAATRKSEDDGDFWTSIAGRFSTGIMVVKVYGTISMPEKESYYGEGAQDIADVLHKLRKRDEVKGVVLRVNSPGGSVGASQEIYEEIKALSEKKKVVVSMGDMAASGGYYISAPADYIYCNPGTITGSIGVITQTVLAKDLIDKIGLQFNVFKSGALKDMGSMSRPTTKEEEAVFESIVMGAYAQFVKAVTDGRTTVRPGSGRKVVLKTEADVQKLADGRIYLGTQAVANGLADETGTLWDAIAKCGELAGLGRDPTVLKSRSMPSLPDFMRLAGSDSSTNSLGELASKFLACSNEPVLYLYRP
jgi:signal peptide peptidase SppA